LVISAEMPVPYLRALREFHLGIHKAQATTVTAVVLAMESAQVSAVVPAVAPL
jgi:hypothetical protein